MTTLTEYARSVADVGYANGLSSLQDSTTVTSGNSQTWTNPTNFEAADVVYAVANISGLSPYFSTVMFGYNYDFSSIPGGSTISAATCAVTGKAGNASATKSVWDLLAAFMIWPGSPTSPSFSTSYYIGSNLGRAGAGGRDTSVRWPATATTITYTAGTLPTLAQIQNSDFGFAVAFDAVLTYSTGSTSSSMDCAPITITYTAGGGGGAKAAALVAIPF